MGTDKVSSFTDDQSRAIHSLDHGVALLAGAGSGKTAVLVERYAELLKKGTSPFEIFTVTFTVDAAEQMRARLKRRLSYDDFGEKRREKLEKELAATPYLGTLHSFCYRAVNQWGSALGLPRLESIQSSFQYAETFEDRYPRWMEALSREDLRRWLNHFSHRELKEFLFGAYAKRNELKATRPSWKENEEVAWVFDRALDFWATMETSFRSKGLYGFDDLETETLRILKESPEAREHYQRRLKYFFVDEFQDTSPAQWDILQVLSEKAPRGIFIVGDPKQSIYRFRHADYRLFFEACQKIDDTGGESLPLSHNFRTLPGLLEEINRVSGNLFEGTDIPWRPMLAGRSPEEGEPASFRRVRLSGARGELAQKERESCLLEVRRLLDKGVRPGQIALLFRMSDRINEMFELFLAEDIPASAKAVQAIFRNWETLDLVAYLQAVADPLDDFRFASFLRGNYVGWDLSRLASVVTAKGASLYEKSRDFSELNWFHAVLERGDTDLESVLGALFRATKRPPQSRALVMEWLAPLVEERLSVFEALRKIDSWEKNEVMAGAGAAAGSVPDAVQLMTVHGAKGLEFDYVFLLDNLRLPPRGYPQFLHYKNDIGIRLKRDGEAIEHFQYKGLWERHQFDDIAESKRILYVALTRARRELVAFLPEDPGLVPKNTWGEWLA